MCVAECPEVGTASHGATVEEALAMLKEATELYLELPCSRLAMSPRLAHISAQEIVRALE